MSLRAGCVRCPGPVGGSGPDGGCPVHGSAYTLWRPESSSYDAFLEHLATADGFPSYLPWPVASGWRVSDFGVVTDSRRRPVATVGCVSGTTDWDGPVDLLVVSEEPHVGLGGRCAGLPVADPGPGFGTEPPSVRVRVERKQLPLWPVSTSVSSSELDRSVLVGEAAGRWLWLVLMPASALLMIHDDFPLRDVSGVGPALVELSFEGPPPTW